MQHRPHLKLGGLTMGRASSNDEVRGMGHPLRGVAGTSPATRVGPWLTRRGEGLIHNVNDRNPPGRGGPIATMPIP